MLLSLLLLLAVLPRAALAQPPKTVACTGKAAGADCTFTPQGGPNAGTKIDGTCGTDGDCAADAGTGTNNGAGTVPGGGKVKITCPVVGGTPYTGSADYVGKNPTAAPLRGAVGCLDLGVLATRPKAGNKNIDANNLYGPMEAGFSSAQPGASCLQTFELPGGVDTNVAESVMNTVCKANTGEVMQLLDYCGGHASPFHYHERMNCLYSADTTTKHSTRIGTAADGNGVYGHNVDGGCEPTDLDWCGGRTGVTPDSNGKEVYYYVVSNRAPFALGCFGPVTTEAQCRALYPECDGVTVSLTSEHGTDAYDLDCPCFDPATGSNVVGQAKPKFLNALGFDKYVCTDCTAAQEAELVAQYAATQCSAVAEKGCTASTTDLGVTGLKTGLGAGTASQGTVAAQCTSTTDYTASGSIKCVNAVWQANGAACTATSTGGGGSTTTTTKPNILIVHPDDMYPGMGAWGVAPTWDASWTTGAGITLNSNTPNMDRIKNEGISFSRAYTSTSMCSPSRHSVITGRYASRNINAMSKSSGGMTKVTVPNTELVGADKTLNLPSLLKQCGYATG